MVGKGHGAAEADRPILQTRIPGTAIRRHLQKVTQVNFGTRSMQRLTAGGLVLSWVLSV